MVCDTQPSQDEYTHQIWNSYLTEYKRYALDTIILKMRSEVKVSDREMVCDAPSSQNVCTQQIWNFYLKEYWRYVPDSMQLLETRSEQVQGHDDSIMVCDILSSQDASSHQIWDSYLII